MALLDRNRVKLILRLKEAFDRIDQNSDGVLTMKEVRDAFREMGQNPERQEIVQWMKERGSDSRVSFVNFVDAYTKMFGHDVKRHGNDNDATMPAHASVWKTSKGHVTQRRLEENEYADAVDEMKDPTDVVQEGSNASNLHNAVRERMDLNLSTHETRKYRLKSASDRSYSWKFTEYDETVMTITPMFEEDVIMITGLRQGHASVNLTYVLSGNSSEQRIVISIHVQVNPTAAVQTKQTLWRAYQEVGGNVDAKVSRVDILNAFESLGFEITEKELELYLSRVGLEDLVSFGFAAFTRLHKATITGEIRIKNSHSPRDRHRRKGRPRPVVTGRSTVKSFSRTFTRRNSPRGRNQRRHYEDDTDEEMFQISSASSDDDSYDSYDDDESSETGTIMIRESPSRVRQRERQRAEAQRLRKEKEKLRKEKREWKKRQRQHYPPPYGGGLWPTPSVNILPVQTALPSGGLIHPQAIISRPQNHSSEFEDLPVGTVIRKTGKKKWRELDDDDEPREHNNKVENEVLLQTLPKGTLLEKGNDGNWREVDDGSEDVAETLEHLPAGT